MPLFKICVLGGWKDCSTVKNMSCFSRRLRFSSQCPHKLTTVCNTSSRRSHGLFWPPRVLHVCGAQTSCRQNTHIHKNKAWKNYFMFNYVCVSGMSSIFSPPPPPPFSLPPSCLPLCFPEHFHLICNTCSTWLYKVFEPWMRENIFIFDTDLVHLISLSPSSCIHFLQMTWLHSSLLLKIPLRLRLHFSYPFTPTLPLQLFPDPHHHILLPTLGTFFWF